MLAKTISEISRKEIPLLYYFPEEVEKAIQDNRLVVLGQENKNIAFAFWRRYGDWIELSTMYIVPEFRGQGYLHKLVDAIHFKLQDEKANLLLFTQAPQVAHVIERFGFKRAPMVALPLSVLAKIILHRLHPRRWLSYAKHIKNIPRVFKTRLYLRNTAGSEIH